MEIETVPLVICADPNFSENGVHMEKQSETVDWMVAMQKVYSYPLNLIADTGM